MWRGEKGGGERKRAADGAAAKDRGAADVAGREGRRR